LIKPQLKGFLYCVTRGFVFSVYYQEPIAQKANIRMVNVNMIIRMVNVNMILHVRISLIIDFHPRSMYCYAKNTRIQWKTRSYSSFTRTGAYQEITVYHRSQEILSQTVIDHIAHPGKVLIQRCRLL